MRYIKRGQLIAITVKLLQQWQHRHIERGQLVVRTDHSPQLRALREVELGQGVVAAVQVLQVGTVGEVEACQRIVLSAGQALQLDVGTEVEGCDAVEALGIRVVNGVVTVQFLQFREESDAGEVGDAQVADHDVGHFAALALAELAVAVGVEMSADVVAEDFVGEVGLVDVCSAGIVAHGAHHAPSLAGGNGLLGFAEGVLLVGIGVFVDGGEDTVIGGGQALDEGLHVGAADLVAVAEEAAEHPVVRHVERAQLVAVAPHGIQLQVLRQVERRQLVVGAIEVFQLRALRQGELTDFVMVTRERFQVSVVSYNEQTQIIVIAFEPL